MARTPGELIGALTADARRRLVVLPDPQAAHDPQAIAELVGALRDLGHLRIVTGTWSDEAETAETADADGAPPDLEDPAAVCAGDPFRVTAAYDLQGDAHGGLRDLEDPAAVCAGDPFRVTAAYDLHGEAHGGLRAAWFRAGPSLIRDQPVSGRALVLLTALGDDADPRLRPALTALAADAPWRVDWTRVRGDLTPPWPGPVAALAHGTGRWADHLLVCDQRGTIRSLHPDDATPMAGSVPMPVRITALAPLPDGTLLMLDERGRPHTHGRTPLTEAVAATLAKHPGTALAATDGLVLAGDRHGSLHAFGLRGLHQAAPHRGRVTSVTVLHDPAPLVCSGGADGTVHTWSPGGSAGGAPLTERPCPVVALSGLGPALAVAWADGLVELRRLDTGEVLGFRPGQPVRGLAVCGDRSVVIGTDESLFRLTARPAPAP
ncbi:hypothetical protein ACFU5O_31855 [Streptomyces sp. NPDC057445]|uniref:hypothetical protein n=1 Tax=Streptomyces sp. NPDC057445 TaxID=3346136 RepID=UPI0036A0D63D